MILTRENLTHLRFFHCFIGSLQEMENWIGTYPNVIFGISSRSLNGSPFRKLAHAINRDFMSFKNWNFFDIFLIFAQNIDCGHGQVFVMHCFVSELPTIYVLE